MLTGVFSMRGGEAFEIRNEAMKSSTLIPAWREASYSSFISLSRVFEILADIHYSQ